MDSFDSNIGEIFKAVRDGDLENLKSLVDEESIELNIRDEWDSTPLYYACLCGHEDVVEFLLRNGARCEANTFDAERCFYAALTQRIKNTLREYKTVTGESFKRDLYQDFLKGCVEGCSLADILFRVGSESIGAHKIILSARCPYFAAMLGSKWKDRKIVFLRKNAVSPSAFRFFIVYLYTGCIDIPLWDVQDFMTVSKKCQMLNLLTKVERAVRNFHYYADTKPEAMRNRVSLISIDNGTELEDIHESFLRIVELCIPHPLRFQQCFDAVPEIFSISLVDDYCNTGIYQNSSDGKPCFTDVCFVINGHEFYCHKVFFCRRSEYFRALIHFTEAENPVSQDFLFISLNEISPEVFAAVVNFIYTNHCKICPESVYKILYFSDLFLLPGLKCRCAAFLLHELMPENVIYTLKLARLYGLSRLETQCANFIAINLQEVILRQDFMDLVVEDASIIQKREDTDTIQIIDDVRHHLLKLALPGMNLNSFEDADVNDKFDMLDDALRNLGLDA